MVQLMLLFFLLCINITACTEVDLQKRIIGGHECEHQYHVKLRVTAPDGSSSLCGGSLITKRWILTAAHCLKPSAAVFAKLSLHPAQEVKITAEPVIYLDIDKSNNGKVRNHDIMLLQLPKAFDIQPISLPNCEVHPKTLEIAGHGATTGGASELRKPSQSPTLHCVNIDVVDCEDFKKTLKEKYPKVYQVKMYQHWFCGRTPGVDVCFGDSGGGVIHEDQIYGVISFLGDPEFVCRKPAAFMDLCNPAYLAWVQKHITQKLYKL